MKKSKGEMSRKTKSKPIIRVSPKKAVDKKVVVVEPQISWMGGDMNN